MSETRAAAGAGRRFSAGEQVSMVGKGSALIGVATVCLLAAGGVAAARGTAPREQPSSVTPAATHVVTVLDAPTTTEPPQRTPPAPAVVSGGASAEITVTIPPRTFVHLDSTGRPVEAMTNTGRAPQLSDQFFVETGGVTSPASPAVIREVIAEGHGGDWSTPGAWHRLPS